MDSSSLIILISSALSHLDRYAAVKRYPAHSSRAVLQLKIELRNVQALVLVCSRNLGDDLPSLFFGIESAILKILVLESDLSQEPDSYIFEQWMDLDALPEVRGFAKQLADESCTAPLALDDVVALADFILENAADFMLLGSVYRWRLDVDIIDAFVVQVRFLKCFLVFAKGGGAQLQHLMTHFQPFAINAARVFILDQPFDISDEPAPLNDWFEQVVSKCSSAATGIATAPQVYEAYTRALSSSTFFFNTPADAGILVDFLGSLVSVLWDMLCHHSMSRVKDKLKVLYERLRFCRHILKRKPGGFDGAQIGVLICGAGMLVCSLHHTHVELSYPDRLQQLLDRFDALQAQVENNASESTAPSLNELGSSDLAHIMTTDGHEETATSSHQPQQRSSAPQVACFQDDEVNPVLDRLMRGSKQLQIVPICGMAGVGKTTFASTLYNHLSIFYRFPSRAWCLISQVLDKRRVMLQLLDQLNREYFNEESASVSYANKTEDDIANKLRQILKGKRYLIVLDDLWTTEAWNRLAASFPDDSTQSRIIFTSRHHDVVPDQQPHLLRLRDDNECSEILKMKLCRHQKTWNFELGLAAKMCQGLPLIAVIVAGLLASTTEPHGWNRILNHLSFSGVSSEKQCNNALELSFTHLPDDLKLCFLYFAIFREDEEISVMKLLRLWIAEGFVRESGSKRIEDVAREYLENLIQRSLVMVAQNRSIGGVKTCRIHDSMHDFCLRRAKQDYFIHILSQRDDELSDFNEPPNLRRLIIHSGPVHFKQARLFCPIAHSVFLFFSAKAKIFDALFIFQIFKLLNVLDVYGSSYTAGIPSEIELLTQLKYLSIRSTLDVIPSSLGNLSKLETLIGEFWTNGVTPFPHTFWNLHKLKCLYIKHSEFSLSTENLDESCPLLELETLYGIVFNSYSSMEQQMRKFPNVRRLKCRMGSMFQPRFLPRANTTNSKKILISDFLNQLQCLTIFGLGPLRCEFGSSESLRKLTLWHFELSREEIADIGKLPNLEVLKLQDIRFCGDTLDMEEEEFSNLRHLKLGSIWINRWTISDEQLPCLKKLSFYKCDISEELPSDCLSCSATIEEIEVRSCSPNVEDFAREIQQAQEDCGNLVKVHIE